ncbi:MAG: hypothetical protein KA765_02345, partial [Thermoflexales bacterium]|nr:hypothetical protein [Thermoflexales bacterium]
MQLAVLNLSEDAQPATKAIPDWFYAQGGRKSTVPSRWTFVQREQDRQSQQNQPFCLTVPKAQ